MLWHVLWFSDFPYFHGTQKVWTYEIILASNFEFWDFILYNIVAFFFSASRNTRVWPEFKTNFEFIIWLKYLPLPFHKKFVSLRSRKSISFTWASSGCYLFLLLLCCFHTFLTSTNCVKESNHVTFVFIVGISCWKHVIYIFSGPFCGFARGRSW